jgi:hypothetical protein
VKNTGNTPIAPCPFDVEIPGEHNQFLAELTTKDPDLRRAIEITWDEPQVRNDPRFHFRVSPFLNPKESFEILFYFDKETNKCKIHCRIEETKTKIKRGPHLSIADIWAQSEIIPQIIGAVAAGAAAMAAVGLYAVIHRIIT